MEAKAKEQEALASQTSGKAALQHVIAAIELYMQAVQEAQTPAERSRLRKKCAELMAYGEKLKTPKTPKTPKTLKTGKASPPPVAAVEEALGSMSLDGPSPSPAAAKTAVAKTYSTPSASLATVRPVPLSTRELSKKEQIILLKASKLHGSVFPPWDAKSADNIFTLASSNNALYEDDTAFSMSPGQSDIFTGWRRPRDLFTTAELTEPAEPARDGFMVASQEPDLVQDITTDCSVVASLCAMTKFTSFTSSQQASLLSTIMSPYDHASNTPLVSENGRYVFRMNFNGTYRKVVVDDRLPASSSRTLFVVDRRNPMLIWPALLEKAYLKVHGGYDFPGSNSGTDLWVLTGWIPEQVFIQSSSSGSSDLDLDRVWVRIKRAFDRGDVMVTLGTGRLSAEEESLLGLAGEHDYAVLDLQVDSSTGVRRMLVKNPWCDNLVWQGNGLSAEPVSTTTSLSPTTTTGTFWIGFEDVIQYYESLYLNWNPALFDYRQDHHFSWTLPSKAMAHSLASNPQYSMTPDADGNVWILLNRHFQDAELDIVRRKRRSGFGPAAASTSAGSSSSSSSSSSVGYISIHVFLADGKRVQLADRPRWTHRSPLVDSPQTLVCFEAAKGTAYTVVVAQSGLPLPSYSFTLSFFSSPTALQIAPAGELLPHQCELSDGWSRTTAGGSAASPDFVRNPQYALVVPRPTPLTLLLCAEADDVPVRIDLVWARGERVSSLAVRDLVVSSGEYQRGCALAAVVPRGLFNAGSVSTGNGSGSAGFGSGLVEAGTYTVVLSTFERAQQTKYTLRIGSAVAVELHAIAAEDAGRLRTSTAPLMLRGGGGGGDGSEEVAETEVRYEAVVEARLNTRISLIVQAVEQRGAGGGFSTSAAAAAAASTTAVRVSVERYYSHGNTGSGGMGGIGGGGGIYNYAHNKRHGEVIATTGDSSDGEQHATLQRDEEGAFQDMTVAGLRTKEVVLGRAPAYQQQQQTLYQNPGQPAQAQQLPQFRIVAEMRNGRRVAHVGIQVDVLSSDRIAVHPWEEV